MDPGTVLALLGILCAVLLGIVNYLTDHRQWKALHKVSSMLEGAVTRWETMGNVGQQIKAFLFAREAEGEPTNMELLAGMSGSAMYKSMKASQNAELSVAKRQQTAIDRQIVNGAEDFSPEIAIGMKLLGQLGFDVPSLSPEELGYALKRVRGLGILPGGNMQQEGSKPGW